MTDEEREAIRTIASVLADVVEENWHKTVGGMPVAESRVRLLEKARKVLSAPKGGA